MSKQKALVPEWQPRPNHFGHAAPRPAITPTIGPTVGRRDFFKLAGTGLSGFFLSPMLRGAAYSMESAADTAGYPAILKNTARNCVFVLCTGAPSHADTFDLKVGAWTPADFNPTTYNGVLFPQGLMPELAKQLNRLAIVRSLRAPALVHPLQQTWVQISRSPSSALGKIAPNIGSVVALEFEKQRKPSYKLPSFISLNTGGAVVGAGYFNGLYSPFDVQPAATGIPTLVNADGQARFESRYAVLQMLDSKLRTNSPLGDDPNTMGGFYERGKAMMYDPTIDAAFKYTAEEATRYGTSNFGNSCIVARNLLKADLGTRYIQINFGSWDHHQEIYAKGANGADVPGLYSMASNLDEGLARLLDDLAAAPGQNGGTLLDETLVVVMGEFGRTVGALTDQDGRDHYFQHFAVFAGGGVAGGRIVGETTADGGQIKDPGWSQNRAIANEDIAATIYSALGIDYTTVRRDDPFGRGFDYVPFASEGAWYPVTELFGRSVSGRSPVKRGGGRTVTQ
jgi:hypothetical protein